MNVSPAGRIVPLRQPVCGWCVLFLLLFLWLAILAGVWAVGMYMKPAAVVSAGPVESSQPALAAADRSTGGASK